MTTLRRPMAKAITEKKVKQHGEIIGIPMTYGPISFMLAGGSFNDAHNPLLDGFYKVKMAAEIHSLNDLAIDTQDFQIPNREELLFSIPSILTAIVRGQDIYIGCAGGIGRTGFMMAIIAKVFGEPCPVDFIRKKFKAQAVETDAQMILVDSIDPRPYQDILEGLLELRESLGLTKQTTKGIVTK